MVNFTTDFDTAILPAPLEAKDPVGSLVYTAGVDALIHNGGDTDSFTVDLNDGMSIALVADAGTTLQPAVALFAPGGASMGTATGAAVGEDAVLPVILLGETGTYKVTVAAVGGTFGDYSLRLVLDAAMEDEWYGGPANDDAPSAQDLDSSFLSLGDGVAQRGAALGSLGDPASTIRVNFQPNWANVPEGYLPNTGLTFADRGNGFSYGWSQSIQGDTRDRGVHPDQRYDTLVHLEAGGVPKTWEIAVDNGIYNVFAVFADPSNTNQINTVDIEGAVVTDPDGGDQVDEYSLTAMVTDGRLTIQPAAGSSDAKIAFLEISRAGPDRTGIASRSTTASRPRWR